MQYRMRGGGTRSALCDRSRALVRPAPSGPRHRYVEYLAQLRSETDPLAQYIVCQVHRCYTSCCIRCNGSAASVQRQRIVLQLDALSAKLTTAVESYDRKIAATTEVGRRGMQHALLHAAHNARCNSAAPPLA